MPCLPRCSKLGGRWLHDSYPSCLPKRRRHVRVSRSIGKAVCWCLYGRASNLLHCLKPTEAFLFLTIQPNCTINAFASIWSRSGKVPLTIYSWAGRTGLGADVAHHVLQCHQTWAKHSAKPSAILFVDFRSAFYMVLRQNLHQLAFPKCGLPACHAVPWYGSCRYSWLDVRRRAR